MKKILIMLIASLIALASVLPVYAADGKVTYSGNAGEFVFAPGGDDSLTDLFPNFKGVMPGDSLTQKITVKNDASNDVKVKIYIRSLGADDGSADFLSKLGLKVKKSDENEMAYMFDASANVSGQLTDWVYLGTLYSGGEVNLDVTLNVPKELDNAYQSKTGKLSWEFMVEELPIEDTDPKPPQTGDSFSLIYYVLIMTLCLFMIVLIAFARRKRDRNKEKNAA